MVVYTVTFTPSTGRLKPLRLFSTLLPFATFNRGARAYPQRGLLTLHALHSLVLRAEVILYIFLTPFPCPTWPLQRCPPEQQCRVVRLCRSKHRLSARTCIQHASWVSHRALLHDVSWLSSAKTTDRRPSMCHDSGIREIRCRTSTLKRS